MPVSAIHAALRDATADLHEAVETGAGVEEGLRRPECRAATMARLLTLHETVERGLEPWAEALNTAGYAPPARARMIRDGLAAFPGTAPVVPGADAPASFGEALGWLYVAEGSMLGGRVMRRAMVADGVDPKGLDFLDPHGDETGARWRALLQVLETACATGRAARADILKGGRDAFDLACRLLIPTSPERVPS